ncbi:MAG: peptide deformylase [Melioribacteraceae bacterium]|nr:peptide deformylase [Melioribacteraceae bacterium]MCO6473309.1 peptide deformylase [Melioribacteraceae bacterium]
MSIIPITIYGDSILRKKVEPVKQIDDKIIAQVKSMFDTMRNASGIGLASNQVGIDNSIFVVDISPIEGCEDYKPVAMINPEIIDESDEIITMEEGCLSLPLLRADVDRPEKIRIKYLDVAEKELIVDADDLFARVIQHEYDHLIGKMIPDRVSPRARKKMQSELHKIMNREVDIDYPITGKN